MSDQQIVEVVKMGYVRNIKKEKPNKGTFVSLEKRKKDRSKNAIYVQHLGKSGIKRIIPWRKTKK